jgi:hypothetical protein
MQKLEYGALVQIDLTKSHARKDTVLSFTEDLLNKGKSNDNINEELKFRIVSNK